MPAKTPQTKKGHGCLKGCLIILVIPILLLIGISGFISQEWNRSDRKVLSDVHPVAEIAEIPDKTGMNEFGRATFYRGDPVFTEGSEFRKHCLGKGELALGCTLFGPGKGPLGLPVGKTNIYILRISDPEFSTHIITTGAHEMLHVAYRRMGSTQKKKIDALIDGEIAKRPSDQELNNRVSAMKKIGIKYQDELHSQLGVLYQDISPELEEHYSQYFSDRRKLIYLAQNDGLNKNILRLDAMSAELKSLNSKLTAENNQLETYKKSGDKASFDKLALSFNSQVDFYNAKVREVNRLNNELKEFYHFIDPSYQPAKELKK